MEKLLFCICLTLLGTTTSAQMEMSSEARDYLEEYISITKSKSMLRDSVDWNQFEELVYKTAKGSQTPGDTYSAIKIGLDYINDGHSFLMTAEETEKWKNEDNEDTVTSIPGPIPFGALIEGVGYIRLPWFHSGNDKSCQLFADTLQSVIIALDTNTLDGWIIDLRDNLGGNNWPMHAGISSLYVEEQVGSSIYPDGRKEKWIIRDGGLLDKDGSADRVTSIYTLKNKNRPIAILINGSTASSGETVLVSFIGADNVKTFGVPSRGSTTGNELCPLSDGAQLLLTTSVYADRNNKAYYGPISPDVYVPETRALPSRYLLMKTVLGWIKAQ